MDGIEVWHTLKWIISGFALVYALGIMVLVWRLRGIFNWRLSLKRELIQLQQQQSVHRQPRSAAISVVVARCREIRRAQSIDFDKSLDIPDYIRSIAACYHPEEASPETKIPVGHLIRASARMSERLQYTLNRPFLRGVKHLRIRHIRQAYEWYRTVMASPLMGPFLSTFRFLQHIFHLLRWIFLDPFSWVSYLSGRLAMLIMAKSLLMDFYLYLGKLAIDAYDPLNTSEPENVDEFSTEEGIKEMAGIGETADGITDPRILAIRDALVGFPGRLISPPRLREVRAAIVQSAEILAGRYFPHAVNPLEEAALGPILERTSEWLRSIAGLEKYRVIRQIYHIPLDTVYNANTIASLVKSSSTATVVKQAMGAYRWMKWPWKIYRWSKKTAPATIALSMGWELSKKGAVNFFCRYLFDRANKEIDQLYSQSFGKSSSPESRIATNGN